MADIFDFIVNVAVKGAEKTESAVSDISGKFKELSGALNKVRALAAGASPAISKDFQAIGAQIKSTSQASSDFAKTAGRQLTDFAMDTGLSVSEAGQFFGELANQTIILTELSREEVETFGRLNQQFGLSADRVAAVVSASSRLGISVTDLTNQVVEFSDKFDVPGLMQALPEIVEGVDQAFSQFGARVVGDSSQIVAAITKQSAAIAKGYGIDATQAVNKVIESFNKFNEELSTAEDVRLGLADDFGAGTKALFQLGVSAEQAGALLKVGQEDAFAFAEQIKAMTDARFSDSRSRRRAMKEIANAFDGEVKSLLLNDEKFASLAKAREDSLKKDTGAAREATKVFKDMRSSMGAALLTFDNMTESLKTLFGLTLGPAIKVIFDKGAVLMKGIGDGARLASEWFGSFGVKMESLAKPLLSVSTVIPLIAKVGVKGIAKLIPGVNTLVGLFFGLSKALEELAAGKSGFQVLNAFAVEFIDSMLFGIPTIIAQFLGFNDTFATLSYAFERFGLLARSVWEDISLSFFVFSQLLQQGFHEIVNVGTNIFNGFKVTFTAIWHGLQDVVGTVVATMGGLLYDLIAGVMTGMAKMADSVPAFLLPEGFDAKSMKESAKAWSDSSKRMQEDNLALIEVRRSGMGEMVNEIRKDKKERLQALSDLGDAQSSRLDERLDQSIKTRREIDTLEETSRRQHERAERLAAAKKEAEKQGKKKGLKIDLETQKKLVKAQEAVAKARARARASGASAIGIQQAGESETMRQLGKIGVGASKAGATTPSAKSGGGGALPTSAFNPLQATIDVALTMDRNLAQVVKAEVKKTNSGAIRNAKQV